MEPIGSAFAEQSFAWLLITQKPGHLTSKDLVYLSSQLVTTSTYSRELKLKSNNKPRQSEADKVQHLEQFESLLAPAIATVIDENGAKVGRRQRAAVANKLNQVRAALTPNVRQELIGPSQRWRDGVCSIIDGRHGWPCGDTSTKAEMFFDTLALIHAPLMVLDETETHDRAWRILRGPLPAFCDMKGRAWVDEVLDLYKSDFERIAAKHFLDGGSGPPPLLIRPVDIAWTHNITLEELRAYGANRCGLTSINPETREEKRERDRAAQEDRRRKRGARPRKDCTLTEDRKAYAKRHNTTVYEVTKLMKAGALTRDELREPDDLRKNASRLTFLLDATEIFEPDDALVIHPATVAGATAGLNASHGMR